MFTIFAKDKTSYARTGLIQTPHGTVETPSYVVVGTHAKVRTLDTADLIAAKTQLIISNTYHLWRELGEDGLVSFPGLHARFGQWPKPLMTDSGGFQVFSFGIAREQGTGKVAGAPPRQSAATGPERNLVRISEEGVAFREGNANLFLDAETSIRIQQQLGADIILAFDEPTSPLHDYMYTKEALGRTHRWAERSLKARTSSQLMYGIIQGGSFEDLRGESARVIGAMPFDGFAIGGAFSNSFGSTRDDTRKELAWTCPFLPENKPRHLLGIGLVEDLFDGVTAGIDTFDCVVPTREARHGSVWTRTARIDIKRGRYQADTSILDEDCACPVCTTMKITKANLYDLFHTRNQEAGRLASLHNVYFFNNLMSEIRIAIQNNTFRELRERYIQAS